MIPCNLLILQLFPGKNTWNAVFTREVGTPQKTRDFQKKIRNILVTRMIMNIFSIVQMDTDPIRGPPSYLQHVSHRSNAIRYTFLKYLDDYVDFPIVQHGYTPHFIIRVFLTFSSNAILTPFWIIHTYEPVPIVQMKIKPFLHHLDDFEP